jgi:uncharacterized membrane protein
VSPTLPITLPPAGQQAVWVTVTVPADALSGTVDTTIITATSQADPDISAHATDTTIVNHAPGVALAPDRSGSADPGTFITYTHTLTNAGNYTDTFMLTHTSSQGWAQVSPTLPTILPPGGQQAVWVTVTVPADAAGGAVDATVITAASQAEPDVFAHATDTTTVNPISGVILAPDHSSSADPGTSIIYPHTLTNVGNYSDTFVLTHTSSQGWAQVSPTQPIMLLPGGQQAVWVTVAVPADALSGTVDITVVTATSQIDPDVVAHATDTTTVNHVPGVALVPDHSSIADLGMSITYTHTLANAGNGADTFALSHASSQGWAVAYDTPVALAAGQATMLLITVTVPADAISGTVDTTILTATSQVDTGVSASVVDTTAVRGEVVEGWDIYLPLVLRNYGP